MLLHFTTRVTIKRGTLAKLWHGGVVVLQNVHQPRVKEQHCFKGNYKYKYE